MLLEAGPPQPGFNPGVEMEIGNFGVEKSGWTMVVFQEWNFGVEKSVFAAPPELITDWSCIPTFSTELENPGEKFQRLQETKGGSQSRVLALLNLSWQFWEFFWATLQMTGRSDRKTGTLWFNLDQHILCQLQRDSANLTFLSLLIPHFCLSDLGLPAWARYSKRGRILN